MLTHPVPTETVRLPSGIHRRPGCKRPPRARRHRQAGCVSGSWGLSGTGGRVEQTLCHLVESLIEVALMLWRPPWPCAHGEPCPSVLSTCSPTTLERGRFKWRTNGPVTVAPLQVCSEYLMAHTFCWLSAPAPVGAPGWVCSLRAEPLAPGPCGQEEGEAGGVLSRGAGSGESRRARPDWAAHPPSQPLLPGGRGGHPWVQDARGLLPGRDSHRQASLCHHCPKVTARVLEKARMSPGYHKRHWKCSWITRTA